MNLFDNAGSQTRTSRGEKGVVYAVPILFIIMVVVGISWSGPLLHGASLGRYQSYIDQHLQQNGVFVEIRDPPRGSNLSLFISVSGGVYDEVSNQTKWGKITQAAQWLINQTTHWEITTVYRNPPPPPRPVLAESVAFVWWFDVNETLIKLIIGFEIS